MGNFIVAIFIDNIFKNSVPSVFIKINVNIRHGNTVRIQETLKEQIIFDRIYIGDP